MAVSDLANGKLTDEEKALATSVATAANDNKDMAFVGN